MVLEIKGCRVLEAVNGKEAVKLASQTHPALILMDLSMPVLDGYEATRQILAQPELDDTPVVAISAFCDIHNREKALAAGCIECINKPINFGLIDGLLHRHLHAC